MVSGGATLAGNRAVSEGSRPATAATHWSVHGMSAIRSKGSPARNCGRDAGLGSLPSRSRITIASKEDDPKRPQFGRVVEKVEVLNQRDETVLACEHVLLVRKRDAAV